MESSPLIKAHDHARAAALATQSANTTVAISEHALAAGEFSTAAKNTTSVEALRTLKLLEQHHQRLAELLKFPPQNSTQSLDATVSAHEKDTDSDASTGPKQARGPPSARRFQPRDLTSSIANNLASARGIRSQHTGRPVAPTVSSDQAPGSLGGLPQRGNGRSSMKNVLEQPPSSPRSQELDALELSSSSSAQSKDGYSRFYNTFGTLINRLSAPLAFAGLPLISEESEESTTSEIVQPPAPLQLKRHQPKPTPAAPLEPDLTKIYSHATLRAVQRDGYSGSDSFYVVPTSGHTMSYASILSFAEKEKRRLKAIGAATVNDAGQPGSLEDDEDFFDAREQPPSPTATRRSVASKGRGEIGMLRNTVEELHTENKHLKDMLDKLSKRLHAFEASAQSSTLALAESRRFLRPGSPSLPPMANALSERARAADNMGVSQTSQRALEEELGNALKRIEALEKENRSMGKNLVKYREAWDKLKENARARRNATTAATTNRGSA